MSGHAPQPQESLPIQQMSVMSLQGVRAGDTPLLSQFVHGSVMSLESVVTGASLCIRSGDVEARGNREQSDAQFTVHINRPGVVALQNVQHPEWWLAIYNGRINGSGTGGPYCEFVISEAEGKFVFLESAMFPGHFLGIQDNGSLKPPTETAPSQRESWFVPFLKDSVPPPYNSLQGHAPSIVPVPVPIGGGAPGYPHAPPQSYPQQPGNVPPSPQGIYPSLPPGAPVAAPGYPVDQYGYPIAPAYPQQPMPANVPQGPCLPYGYNVLDVFQSENVIRLIPCSDAHKLPIKVVFPKLTCNGDYSHKDSEFVVSSLSPGVVRLRSGHWGKCHLYINSRGVIGADGKDPTHTSCHFRVHLISSNCVSFESVRSPGWFLCMSSKGRAGDPRTVQSGSPEAQFFVRVERILNPYSAPIMTPFGRQSIANGIRDRNLLQLYVNTNGTNTYLAIDRRGRVQEIQDPNDKQSYFVFFDRGFGMLSLESYSSNTCRLRLFDYKLQGTGDPNMNADFFLKENADGSVCFESVTCPGALISTTGAVAGKQTNFRLNLLNVQKEGKSEKVLTYPLN